MTGCPVADGYDPLDPETVLDPYPTFNRLRDEGPVFYMPELDHYIITRYADIEQVLLDRDTWSASNASSPLTPVCPTPSGLAQPSSKRPGTVVPPLLSRCSPTARPSGRNTAASPCANEPVASLGVPT